MVESFELKRLTEEGLPAALERAEHYRLLNQPELAESICLDILEVEPDNQRALVVLILAITDQFETGGSDPRATAARKHVDRLSDPYQRSYYAGIISERRARAFLSRGPSQQFAYQHFRQAMEFYEEAAAIRPAGNDDAILRWNTCARSIKLRKLRPRPEREGELQLE
ncbi:MAG: hypothetical protein ACE5MI_12315 [Acidimicrobiia bacterium]